MTIDYRILIGEQLTPQRHAEVEQLLQHTFSVINDVYNKWNPNSELSKINRLKAHVKTPISPALEGFLLEIQKIVDISDGRFDPTIEPLQELWKTKLAQQIVPSEEEINAVLPAIGWHKIHFGNGLFYKDHDFTSIDLGGIAKGYCVDLLVNALNKAGYANVYVEWGGEIRASGKHPDDRPWHIFISRLGDTDPAHAIAHLDLIDLAIATSGDYLQKWNVSGTTYFHIFDPKAHRPLVSTSGSIASASVMASNCAMADGLATVAMMFSTVEEAEVWTNSVKEEYPDVVFWLYSREK